MSFVNSIENRVKLVKHILQELRIGNIINRPEDKFSIVTKRAFVERRNNPYASVKILFGVKYNEVVHCWLELNNKEIELLDKHRIKNRNNYDKIVKISIGAEFTPTVEGDVKSEKLKELIRSVIKRGYEND